MSYLMLLLLLLLLFRCVSLSVKFWLVHWIVGALCDWPVLVFTTLNWKTLYTSSKQYPLFIHGENEISRRSTYALRWWVTRHKILVICAVFLQINITLLVLLIPQIVKRDRKDYIISLSKEFSVVSKFTSFVAVEHREKVIFSSWLLIIREEQLIIASSCCFWE